MSPDFAIRDLWLRKDCAKLGVDSCSFGPRGILWRAKAMRPPNGIALYCGSSGAMICGTPNGSIAGLCDMPGADVGGVTSGGVIDTVAGDALSPSDPGGQLLLNWFG